MIMKLIYLLLIVSHTISKSKFNVRNSVTPKGLELNNHFGSSPRQNVYGPRPELISHEAYIRNPDGSVVRKHIRQILHGNMEQYSDKSCDITTKQYYSACMNIKDCDICTASPHCGWCELTQQCLPQKLKQAACPSACNNGWVFMMQSCKGSVRSGRLSNWNHETDRIRTVEYTYPKYKVDTVYTAPQVVRTPVLLGSVNERSEIQKTNGQTNSLVYQQLVESQKPIYGEIHQVLPIDVHSTQYIDTVTGRRVDQWGEHNIQYHGVDDFLITSDLPSYSEIARASKKPSDSIKRLNKRVQQPMTNNQQSSNVSPSQTSEQKTS